MYLVPIVPDSGELPTYNRFTVVPPTFSASPMRTVWRFSDMAIAVGWRVRMRLWSVDAAGVRSVAVVTDWKSYEHPKGGWEFIHPAADGHHALQPEIEGSPASATVISKPIVVNTTAGPLPPALQRWVFVAPLRIERLAGGDGGDPEVVEYPAPRPYRARRKVRVVEPYTTRLPMSQLWSERWGANGRACMYRRFERTAKGDIVVVPEQKYSYGNAISLGEFKAGQVPPVFTARDGPPNWATVTYAHQIIVRHGGNAVYIKTTDGCIMLRQLYPRAPLMPHNPHVPLPSMLDEGEQTLLIGWRVKPGELRQYGSEVGMEYVGDYSRIAPAPPGSGMNSHREHEGWGLAVARLMPDGSIRIRDGLDIWSSNTFLHTVDFIDGWPTHPDVSPMTGRPSIAMFPPVGYDPNVPHDGVSRVVTFAGTPGVITEYCDEPWGIDVDPIRRKIVWSNFHGNSIVESDMDGANKRFILRGPPMSDAALGIPQRLYPSALPLATVRAMMRDGSLDDPATTCIRPQQLQVDADGTIVFVERYTYAVRRIDPVARTVSTIWLVPAAWMSLTSSSSSTQDINFSIDREGSVGPAGDIFLSAWAHSQWRISRDGSYAATFGFNSGAFRFRSGPGELVDQPNYAWGIGVGDGLIVREGNDSGSAGDILTKRLPTDPAPNEALFNRGHDAFQKHLGLTHGAFAYGELGFPNVELMGSWSDAEIRAYAAARGVPAVDLDAVVYWVRYTTIAYDYTVAPPPPPDTTPPASPVNPVVVQTINFNEAPSMYNITVRADIGPEADINRIRFRIGGGGVQEFAAVPGALGSLFTLTHPSDGTFTMEHSFVDASDNESGRRGQELFVPDQEAPAMPGGPATVVSITWVP